MKSSHSTRIIASASVLLAVIPLSSIADTPHVTNVHGEQRPGTDLVDVYYDLDTAESTTVSVSLAVSADGGTNWIVPVVSVSQSVGNGVSPGKGKHILWNAGADWDGHVSRNVRFKVTASDLSFIQSGLVAYFPFDDNANDASGNGNHGMLQGSVTFAPGKSGLAAQFDGTNAYVSVANCPALDLTNSFTLSAWIFQRAAQANGYRIVDKCPAGVPGGWTFDTYGNNSGGHRLRMQGAYHGNNVVGSTDYTLSSWHHIVATVSGTTGRVYVDGQLDGEGIVGNIPSNSLNIFIGGPHPNQGAGIIEFFDGLIDDVRIYNRVLTAAEVQQLLNFSKPL